MPEHCPSNASSLRSLPSAPGEFNSSEPLSFDLCKTWREAGRYLKRVFGEKTMANWGGLWCNRFKEDPRKLCRVIQDTERTLKERCDIENPGGYADDLWKWFASRRDETREKGACS